MTPLSRVFWFDQSPRSPRELPPLASDTRADVVVVGGGIAGLACAQELVRAGLDVVLLEKEFCGAGASGRSSGFITPDSEMALSSLIKTKGVERARRLWEFVLSGVEDIQRNIETHRIECDYQVQDSMFLANSERAASFVRQEHEARIRLGYGSTLYDARSLRSVLGSDECCAAVRYPGTFAINAYSYCQRMRDVVGDAGARIHEQTCVTEVANGQVIANGFTVRAEAIVLCVDRLLPEFGLLESEVYRIQTFLGVTTPLRDREISTIFPEKRLMVWDSDLVYQYFRIVGDNRLLVGGSSLRYTYVARKQGTVPSIVRKMTSFVHEKFPSLDFEIQYFWPGLIGVSKDLLPLVGRDPDRPTISYVSGATGLPWAAALGRYAAEKIHSNRADYDSEFAPTRDFAVGNGLQHVIGKPGAFAISHGIVKLSR